MTRHAPRQDGPRSSAEETGLGIPDARPWRVWARRRLDVPAIAWLLAFLMIQCVALGLALGLHPAGFDECEATASSEARTLQAIIAGTAVLGSAALAMWRVRGLLLPVALAVVAISGLCWWVLLGVEQHC